MGTATSGDTAEKLARIRERLSEYYHRREIEVWLRSPHPMLGFRRARDLINDGKEAEVEAVIDQLARISHTVE